MQEALNPPPGAGGVYVHIPFCLRKCPYCDFFSTTDLSLADPFLLALEKEMGLAGDRSFPCDSLYLGGGTPSLLDPSQAARILDGAARSYRLLDGAEVTLEANPGTVDFARIAGYRAAGFNRINVGVQSFDGRRLGFLGRIHTARDATRTLEWARRAGFDNVGLDLIYGLPGQTEAEWRDDLEQALSWSPEHLSCYMLTYEKGTPLDRLRRRNRVRPLEEGRVAGLFRFTVNHLARRGYHHYEISNFARAPRLRSRHNRKYWNFQPYVGLGPSAHSYLPPVRRWNRPDVGAYIRDLEGGRRPASGEETLTRRQEMIEALYLGLRQTGGISLAGFSGRFGAGFEEVFPDGLPALMRDGLVRIDAGRCALTLEGMLFLDAVAARLAAEVE